MKRGTIFSPCRRYRYVLWREWPEESNDLICPAARRHEYVQFIGLNPSTADETNDDPTVRRCIAFAKSWGFGAMCMTNAFAWRDTDPEKMKAVENPIGERMDGLIPERNDRWLLVIAREAGLVVAAWGRHGSHLGRGEHIRDMIPNLHCLGVNEDGTPKHPLYLLSTKTPVPYQLCKDSTVVS